MFTSSKKKTPFRWVNCLNGQKGSADSLPARFPLPSANPALGISAAAAGLLLEATSAAPVLVNGTLLRPKTTITETSTVQLEDGLFVISGNEDDPFDSVQTGSWVLFDATTGDLLGELPPQQLLEYAANLGRAVTRQLV
jgi:hypothetical protein